MPKFRVIVNGVQPNDGRPDPSDVRASFEVTAPDLQAAKEKGFGLFRDNNADADVFVRAEPVAE